MLIMRCIEAERLSRATGRIVKVVPVFDVEGSGITTSGMPSLPAFDDPHNRDLNEFAKQVMIEILGPCYVLNAPWMMVRGFNWFRALIPEKLARKLTLLDGDGSCDSAFVELVGGQEQLSYMLSTRMGTVAGVVDDPAGQETVSAGGAFQKRRDVCRGQLVKWSFEVQPGYADGWLGHPDLEFSVSASWLPDTCGRPENLEEAPLLLHELGEDLVKAKTYNPTHGVISGTYPAKRTGVITLRWSNQHSLVRGKVLQYSVEVTDGSIDKDAEEYYSGSEGQKSGSESGMETY